jgi:hypothetical protein
MSRTGLDAATLARSLRDRAGDGSIEWVSQPIQASVLLDVADMLDENDRLREMVPKMAGALGVGTGWCYSTCSHEFMCDPLKECPIEKAMTELGIEVPE